MSLRTRLALVLALLATLVAALMGVLAYAATAERLRAQADVTITATAESIARQLRGRPVPPTPTPEPSAEREGVAGDDGPSATPTAEGAADAAAPRSRVTLVALLARSPSPSPRRDRGGGGGPGSDDGPDDPDGDRLLPAQLLTPTGSVEPQGQNPVVLPVSAQDRAIAAAEYPARAYADVSIDGRPYRVVTEGLGGGQGAVQVGINVADIERVLSGLAWRLTAIGLGVGVLGALAGWLVARRITRRLVELSGTAQQVASTGRLDVPVPVGGGDEVGRLGDSFNTMLGRLAAAREDQQRLVQDAAHELRTPLTSLRTNLALLRRFDALDAEQRAHVLADLDGESRELTTLVDEVVQLAIEPPADVAVEPLVLADVAERAVQRAHRRSGRDIRLVADEATVVGDAGSLERAVWNLLDNAVKFDGGDGPLDVEVTGGRVTVLDRGPGIPVADLPHVFDRFHRSAAARALPGSGLGLAIVQEVAERHGGGVFAANRDGGGAAIGFWVPARVPAPERVAG